MNDQQRIQDLESQNQQLTAACAEWRNAATRMHAVINSDEDLTGEEWECQLKEAANQCPDPCKGNTAGQSLLDELDAAKCTLEDEEAAHQGTLRLLKLRDEELERVKAERDRAMHFAKAIASQNTADEIEEEDADDLDYEGAFHSIIYDARTCLAALEAKPD